MYQIHFLCTKFGGNGPGEVKERACEAVGGSLESVGAVLGDGGGGRAQCDLFLPL